MVEVVGERGYSAASDARRAADANEEVIALSPLDPRREQALKLLSSWKVTIEASGDLDEEGGELAMALSQAYLEWEKQTEQRARQQALFEALLEVLRVRLGPVPDELREQLQTRGADQLQGLFHAALTCADLESFLQRASQI